MAHRLMELIEIALDRVLMEDCGGGFGEIALIEANRRTRDADFLEGGSSGRIVV